MPFKTQHNFDFNIDEGDEPKPAAKPKVSGEDPYILGPKTATPKTSTPAPSKIQSDNSDPYILGTPQKKSGSVSTNGSGVMSSPGTLPSQEITNAESAYQNKKLTTADLDILSKTEFGKAQGLDMPKEFQPVFVDAHNGEKKSELVSSVFKTIDENFPKTASIEQNLKRSEIIKGVATGDPDTIVKTRNSIIESKRQAINKIRQSPEGDFINVNITAGLAPVGPTSRKVSDNQREQITALEEQIKTINQTFDNHLASSIAAKGKNDTEIGKEIDKKIGIRKTVPNNDYEWTKAGLESKINNLSMEARDLIVQGGKTKNPAFIQQANDKINEVEKARARYDNLSDEFPDVGVFQTARFLGDILSETGGTTIASKLIISKADVLKAAQEAEKRHPGFLKKYGKYVDVVAESEGSGIGAFKSGMIPQGGLFGGAKAGVAQMAYGASGVVARAVGDKNYPLEKEEQDKAQPQHQGTSTAGILPTTVVYDKNGKAYREKANEHYSSWDWNSSMYGLGRGLPALAEFIALDKGIGGLAKVAGKGISLGLSGERSAAALKSLTGSSELIPKAASVSEKMQRTLGLYGATYVSSYDENHKFAEQLIPKADDEAKRNALAHFLTLTTAGMFHAVGGSPTQFIERSLAKAVAPDAIALLEKEGWEIGEKEAGNFLKESVLPRIKSLASNLGQNVVGGSKIGAATVADQKVKDLAKIMANPDVETSTLHDNLHAFAEQVLLMGVAGLPGMIKSGVMPPSYKDALYNAGLLAPQHLDRINARMEAGEITPEQGAALKSQIRTIGEEVFKARLSRNKDGLPLTTRQIKETAIAGFRKRAAEAFHPDDVEGIHQEADALIQNVQSENGFQPIDQSKPFISAVEEGKEGEGSKPKTVDDIDPAKKYMWEREGKKVITSGARLIEHLSKGDITDEANPPYVETAVEKEKREDLIKYHEASIAIAKRTLATDPKNEIAADVLADSTGKLAKLNAVEAPKVKGEPEQISPKIELSIGESTDNSNVPRITLLKSIEKEVENEHKDTMQQMRPEASEDARTEVLLGLPQRIYERMAKKPPFESNPEAKRHLQGIFEGISEAWKNREEELRGMSEPELADASRQLFKTIRSKMALPEVSPGTTRSGEAKPEPISSPIKPDSNEPDNTRSQGDQEREGQNQSQRPPDTGTGQDSGAPGPRKSVPTEKPVLKEKAGDEKKSPEISGITPEEKAKVIAERKSKWSISPRQEKINGLIEDAAKFNAMRKNDPARAEKLNSINLRAKELDITFNPESGKFSNTKINTVKSGLKKAGKIQARYKAESNQALTDKHTPLRERSPEVQNNFQRMYEAANGEELSLMFPNDVLGPDGKRLNEDQLEQAIQDIADGIPSIGAEAYLNEFQDMLDKGEMRLSNNGQSFNVAVKEFMESLKVAIKEENAFIEKETSEIVPEDTVLEWMKEDVNNEYETNIEQTDGESDTEGTGLPEGPNANEASEGTNRPLQPEGKGPAANESVKGTDTPNESEKSSSGAGKGKDKSITEQGAEFAKKLRALKSKADVAQANIFGVPIAIYDGLIETIATAVENGAKIADAVKEALGNMPKGERKKLDEEAFIKHIDDFAEGKKPTLKVQLESDAPVSSLKNRIADPKAEALGLKELPEKVYQSNSELQEAAKQAISDGFDVPNMIDDILHEGRPLKPLESAVLGQYMAAKEAEIRTLQKKIVDATNANDGKALRELKKQFDTALIDINEAHKARKTGGSQLGKGLQSLKIEILEDDSLGNLFIRKQEAVGSDILSDEQKTEVIKQQQEIEKTKKEYEAKIEELKEAHRLELEKAQIAKLKNEVAAEAAKKEKPKSVADKKQALKEERKNIFEEIKNKWKDAGKDSLMSVPLPYLPQLAAITPELVKLTKNLIKEGYTDIGEIVSKIHSEIKDYIDEDITPRDIRDAISGYGKISKPSQDELSIAFRKAKEMGRLISQLEDAEKKLRPMKSGAQRDKVSDEVRQMRQKVKQAMKENQIELTPAEEEHKLKSALDAVKTRLRNQITDITKQIETGEKTPKKIGVKYDAEAEALRAKRDVLREELEAIEGKPGMSDEQRVNLATKAAERSILEYDRRIKQKDFSKRLNNKTPETPELKALRSVRDALQKDYQNLKNAQKTKKTAEEIALASFKKRMQNKEKELYDKISKGDFEKTKPKPLVLDQKAIELKRAYRKAKEDFEVALYKDELKKRSKGKKALDFTTSLLGTGRSIMTSIDFSAPLRQGLIPTISHPIIASKAFVEMFQKAFSKTKFEDWIGDLKESPEYKLMEESGLYISDPRNALLAAKEEAYMTNFAGKIPLVGPLILGSERAYTFYLNKMRADVFTQGIRAFKGKTFETDPELFKSFASYVNNATGRGSLGALETSAQHLNTLFFSPRLMASRIALLNPYTYYKMPAEVRMQAIKDMAITFGVGLTVLQLAKLAGATVEDDVRSTDFGKIRIGDTRWDVWGGFQQYVRLFGQVVSGQTKSTASGTIRDLDPNVFPYESRGSKVMGMLRGKLAPIPATIVNLGSGKDAAGNETSLQDEALKEIMPLYVNDILSSYNKDKSIGDVLGVAIPSMFGVGVQTYSPKKKKSD